MNTIEERRIQVYMKHQENECADGEQSKEYTEPTFISLWDLDDWYEAIKEASWVEQIWEYPNVIIENDYYKINCQSDDNDPNQEDEEDERDEPDTVLDLKGPDGEENHS